MRNKDELEIFDYIMPVIICVILSPILLFLMIKDKILSVK